MVAAASVIRHPERPRLCAQLLDAGDGADTIIAETGAKSALPKIIKAGYSALNVRGAVRAASVCGRVFRGARPQRHSSVCSCRTSSRSEKTRSARGRSR